MQYLWSDAWLLQSIIIANKAIDSIITGQGSLTDIIAAADSINHAMILPGELESGIHRLTAGGYIVETNDLFTTTQKIPEDVLAFVRTSGIYYGREIIDKLLGSEKWSSINNASDPRNNLKYSDDFYNRIIIAEKEYTRRRKNISRKTYKKGDAS